MKMKLIALTALALASFTPVALADGASSLDAIRGDLTTMQADFQATHDVLMADAQTLRADAQALKGGKRADAKVKIKADWTQLKTDYKAKRDKMHADWQQLHTDFQAARAAKDSTLADRQALRQQVQNMREVFKAGRAQVHEAVLAARAAVKDMRASFKKGGAPVSASDANSLTDANVVPTTEP